MRTLIFGTSYIGNDHHAWIVQEWIRLHGTVNPEADLLLVDSASPKAIPLGVDVLQLGDNIGHRWRENYGQDGWGRAFCAGLEHAIREDYDWVACVEADLLCKMPVRELIRLTKISGKHMGAPRATPHRFVEAGLMVMNTDWLEQWAFIHKYDWCGGTVFPETRLENIAAEELHWLEDVKGVRLSDDGATRSRTDLRRLDYLTHATIPEFCEFLESR
jgi:hypothetical protein